MGSTYSKGLNPLVLIHWAIHSKSNYLPCICVCVFFQFGVFFALDLGIHWLPQWNRYFSHVHDKMSINYGELNVVYQFLDHSLYVKQFNLTSLYTWDLNCITQHSIIAKSSDLFIQVKIHCHDYFIGYLIFYLCFFCYCLIPSMTQTRFIL